MSLTIKTCSVCGTNKKFKYKKCFHCRRKMCPKCNKGALCIDCFEAAPTSVQRSWTRTKILTHLLVGVIIASYTIPFAFLQRKTKTQNLFNFSDTTLIILAGVCILGSLGVIIVVKKYDGWQYRWYLKNRAQLPPNEFS